jgi:hypothetical protein
MCIFNILTLVIGNRGIGVTALPECNFCVSLIKNVPWLNSVWYTFKKTQLAQVEKSIHAKTTGFDSFFFVVFYYPFVYALCLPFVFAC